MHHLIDPYGFGSAVPDEQPAGSGAQPDPVHAAEVEAARQAPEVEQLEYAPSADVSDLDPALRLQDSPDLWAGEGVPAEEADFPAPGEGGAEPYAPLEEEGGDQGV